MSSGIYSIHNLINNKQYIGSSKNIVKRKNSHFSNLNNNCHHTSHLQSAFIKYGSNNFDFRVLLLCEPFELLRYEQFFIDYFQPEYNARRIATANIGISHSEESKKLMSESKIGHIVSDETRKKISASKKGVRMSETARRNIVNAVIGRKHSDETKDKISKAHKGKTLSDEHKQKLSASHKGITQSEETKKKRSVQQKGRTHSEETKNKLSEMAKERFRIKRLMLLTQIEPISKDNINANT